MHYSTLNTTPVKEIQKYLNGVVAVNDTAKLCKKVCNAENGIVAQRDTRL